MSAAVTRPGWHRSAACKTADPELFFGADYEDPATRLFRETAALDVCAACPVTNACLNDALAVPGPRDHGIAGGMTENDRARYRRTLTRRYLAARRKAAAA
jgi:WhiB family transcriptional regulator, redox-sensing transcriptional regulator